ncbi:MAG: glycosyltransferase family 39 protein [Anaerolineales bacterium]|nr:glycosyltransferase family 39 protein [Anaerolineales bacterium]
MVRRLQFWLCVLVLLAAAWLRVWRLDSVPPGWRDDEVVETTVHARLAATGLHLYFPQAEGHEPLYHYLSAAWIAAAGDSLFSVRLLSACLGLLSVAALYRLARRMFGGPTALLAAAGLALAFWGLMYARFKLRQVSAVAPMLLGFDCLWAALRPPQTGAPRKQAALWAGVWLAVALYTYFAARAVPAILAAFALYLCLFHRPLFIARWRALALAAAVAAALSAPLFLAIASTPGGEARLGVVGQPLVELLHGNGLPAAKNAAVTLSMFAFTGDPEFLYNIPGRAVFGWGGALLFAAGVALALWRRREPRYAFCLLWLVGGLAPAFVSVPAASLGHTIAAQPVVFLFPALAVAALAERIRSAAPSVALPRSLPAALAALYLLTLAARDLPDYFVAWPALPQVRSLYRAELHAAAAALRALPPGSALGLASPALHPADPLAVALDTPSRGLHVVAFTPGWAWAYPAGDAPVFLSAEALPSRFAQLPSGAGYALLTAPLAPPAVPLDAAFANGWTCYGYTAERAAAGLTLSTYWRVTGAYTPPAPRPVDVLAGTPLPLRFFAHVLKPDGALLVGGDRLDVDPATLRPGDSFVQVFALSLPADAPAADYAVQVGLYAPDTGARVPLADGHDALRLLTLTGP